MMAEHMLYCGMFIKVAGRYLLMNNSRVNEASSCTDYEMLQLKTTVSY